MPGMLDFLKVNIAYEFIVVGVVWLAVAYIAGPLVLWPVVTCVAAGVLIRIKPGMRLTWAWGVSSAALGLLVSAYAAYSNVGLVNGPFSTIAVLSLGGFGVFALVHLFLLYGAYSPKGKQVR